MFILSIERHFFLAVSASLYATEKFAATVGTRITFFLLGHPLLCPEFLPGWHRAEHHLTSHRESKFIDELAGEIIALEASLDISLLYAVLDRAYFAEKERGIR